ncbi:MAG TPA: AtpZ/AtpI family protein, partial [Thermoanaerobaculia bacterium]|nr:AtpZ/AtpI family protein [Thermoanaerobaculia bacterium]
MNGGAGPGGDGGAKRYFADVLTFGWVLPAAIAAGAGLGWVLDKVLGLFPVLTVVLGVLGLVAGLRQVYRESAVLSGKGG